MIKDKTILKLKKLMDNGAKSIALGDKAIQAIKDTQNKVVEGFNSVVLDTVRKSEEQIAYHQDIINEVKGMTL